MMAVVAGCADDGGRSVRETEEAGYAAFGRRNPVMRVSGKKQRSI